MFIVGYDGYSSANVGNKEQELFLENEFLFTYAKDSGINLISLTPTRYKSLTDYFNHIQKFSSMKTILIIPVETVNVLLPTGKTLIVLNGENDDFKEFGNSVVRHLILI